MRDRGSFDRDRPRCAICVLDEIRRKLTRFGMPEQIPERWPLRRRVYLKTMNTLQPLLRRGAFGQRKRELGLDWPADAETMIGMQRLTSLQNCVETVLTDDVPGNLVECGVWRGGASILMRAVLSAYEDKTRSVWLCDSFEGPPRPDTKNYKADKWMRFFVSSPIPAAPQSEVSANFERYGLPDDRVGFVKGRFNDTLQDAPIDRIAVLRLDGDLYESTVQALDALYPRLSPGGFCIIDHYVLKPYRQAVADYREKHGISEEIIDIDGTGALWRKQ